MGANDTINGGLIGFGMRGPNLLQSIKRIGRDRKQRVQLYASCEIYERRAEMLKTRGRPQVSYHNYEDMLADDNVDCVFIAVPDQWHMRISIDAMRAGKDVYCEKPMTLRWEEAQAVARVQEETGCVFQVGAQSASEDRFWQARKLIGNGVDGAIGKVLHFQTSYNRNVPGGDWNYKIHDDCTPETLDWDRWLGPAQQRPFSRERFFRFRKYWDYSGGLATDLLYHQLSHMSVALGFPVPVRVTSNGGIYVHNDGREVPDTFSINADYEGGFSGTLFATAGNDSNLEECIRGEHAKMTWEANAVVLHPQAAWDEQVREAIKDIEGIEIEEIERGGRKLLKTVRMGTGQDKSRNGMGHVRNFFECMRSREKPTLNAQDGAKVMTTIGLGIQAYRENRVMQFDPEKLEVI